MANNVGQSNHALADDEDLVTEILARLPVKSLMRFRCVSKPWRGLISHSHFIKKHRRYAVRGITKNRSSRIIFLTNPPTFIRLEDLEGSGDGLISPTKLELPITTSHFEVWDMKIVGSCSGLVCLELNHGVILVWNPCTGESKLSEKPRNDCVSRFYGFGYDSNMDDYKVVLVGSPLVECDHSFTTFANDTIVHIFALKSCSWDSYELSGTIETLKGPGYLLNGALHWLEFESSESRGGSRILSFHLSEEKFDEIPLPFDNEVVRDAPGGFNGFMTLVDRLCVYAGAFFPFPFTIRMLEKYEDKESWVEILKLDSNVLPDLGDSILYLKPHCIMKSGAVLLDMVAEGTGAQLTLYDPDDERTFRDLVNGHLHLDFDSIICEETLVSPVIGSVGDDDDAPTL